MTRTRTDEPGPPRPQARGCSLPRTRLDAPPTTTDQKVGGSNPSRRAAKPAGLLTRGSPTAHPVDSERYGASLGSGFLTMGSRRTRARPHANVTIAPHKRSSVTAGRLATQKVRLPGRGQLVGGAKQHHRRPLMPTQSQQDTEVGICRNDRPIVLGGSSQDPIVAGQKQTTIRHVHGVVASRTQPRRHAWGEVGVDEQPQPEAASGNSRS